MKIHYLQHAPFEGLGYMEIWLKQNNHSISSTLFYTANYILPAVSEIDALIVMGGPMGIYDDEQHPWLPEEKTFITNCIQASKKVLGICLGAQLIAGCLGAKVSKANHKEIGWFPVIPTEESIQISWFYKLFKNNPIAFHWHGDMFQIPKKALHLLSSEANNNQAFCYKDRVIGLQFHLEVTEETMVLLLEHASCDLKNKPFVQTVVEIESGAKHIKSCNEIMASILSHWLGHK